MSLASQGIKIGAHYPIAAGGDRLEAVNLWERSTARRMDIVNTFKKAGAPSGQFDANARISLLQTIGAGRVPMVTWEPIDAMGKTGPYTLEALALGMHDEYLRTWANGLRDLGAVTYLRLMHEMNGNWYPWAGDPDAYVRAWQAMVGVFRDAGAANVRFVWCVNTSDQPKVNRLEAYWPGREYVDVLGIDGYNNYAGWRSFEQIIRPPYERVCALDPELPVWVCETATAEGNPAVWPGTGIYSKAEWIEGLFATEGMERVEALCWFDQHNPSSFDWRLETTQRSLAAFRSQVHAAAGYVAPPGPYVPPVPDRVKVEYLGPGTISVSWRQIPAFYRGCQVRVRDEGGSTITQNVPKPGLSTQVIGATPGRNVVTVASYTLVRTSAPSASIEVLVEEPI